MCERRSRSRFHLTTNPRLPWRLEDLGERGSSPFEARCSPAGRTSSRSRPPAVLPYEAMNAPRTDTDRLLAAVAFLSEVREADVDCTLTSRSREDLRRLASSGDEDAFAELTRRPRELEPAAA